MQEPQKLATSPPTTKSLKPQLMLADKDLRALYKNFMDITKFKLSLLNSIGAYSMFFFYAPLQGVGLLNSAIFILATQSIAMSSQVFGQVAEAYQDSKMKRTEQRPMVQNKFTSKQGCMIGTTLSVASLLAYHQFVPFTYLVANSVWFSYLCLYLPMKQKSSTNTLVGAVVGALPPFIGTFAQTGALLDLPTFLISSYIFSWQFPHFYGILYANKDDYRKAGFVMISDEDPTGELKAYKQMLYCNIFNTVIPFAMALPSVGLIDPLVLAPFLFYQYQSFKALKTFKDEKASVQSAKNVKKAAYLPFMVLLMGFFATTAYNRYTIRRDVDEQMYSV